MIKKLTYILIILTAVIYISIKQTQQIDPLINNQTLQDIEPVEEIVKEQIASSYKIDEDVEELLKPKEINLEEKNTLKEIKEKPKVQNRQEKQEKVNSKSNENNTTIKVEKHDESKEEQKNKRT